MYNKLYPWFKKPGIALTSYFIVVKSVGIVEAIKAIKIHTVTYTFQYVILCNMRNRGIKVISNWNSVDKNYR